MPMAELRVLGGDPDQASLHVVFVHGLGGGIDTTWLTTTTHGPERWPLWLLEDVPDIAVWAVGYNAAPSAWTGDAMPLEDRADNIWSLLRTEERLARGEVAFVAHSMGGLVTVQVLRCIDRDRTEPDATSFGARVRRLAFLGTPHKGSKVANIVAKFAPIWPTVAIRDLRAESSQLRNLSGWFRKRVRDDELAVLQMVETQRLKFGFLPVPKIVAPDSADAGLVDLPIPVDETHLSICRPKDRQSHVYVAIRSFLTKSTTGRAETTRTIAEIKAVASNVSDLAVKISQPRLRNTTLLDKELERHVERLRQRRVFGEADAPGEARVLVKKIEEGDFALADTSARQEAIAWCARVLASTAPGEAAELLDRHATLDNETAVIARFAIRVAGGELDEALGDIADLATPAVHGAAYIAIQNAKGFEEASAWMDAAGLAFEDLDEVAMVQRVRGASEAGEWTKAHDLASQIEATLLARSAAANSIVADACMARVVSLTSWDAAKQTVLVSLECIAMRDDPDSLILRRRASACYGQLSQMASDLGLPNTANHASDWHLWLDLHDPTTQEDARRRLTESLESRDLLLRRFLWAHQCGIKVALPEVDREIDRQVALSGGTRFEHAAARYAMALAQSDPKAATAYVNRHRDHLLRHLDPKLVLVSEIDMLAQAGETAHARDRLAEAEQKGVDPDVIARLQIRITQTEGGDIITELRKNYERSGSAIDLRALAQAHEGRQEYDEAIGYANKLLKQTNDKNDARHLAILFHGSGRPRDALRILEEYPILLTNNTMRLLQARAHYEIGKLTQAKTELDDLRRDADSFQARLLHLQLRITSGDWAALQAFVEEQWHARAERSPIELLQAGQLAQHIGVSRGKELIREAARSASDDAALLTACYHAASSAGWEDNADVAEWLHQAATLSDTMHDGPIKRVSLDYILERRPEWEAHESRIANLAMRGEAPLFAVGQSLNQSLTRLVLLEAMTNRDQPDVRRRSIILTASGARGISSVRPKSVALDPTALLTAALLDLLTAYRQGYETIWVAHETLGWLFEEHTQLRFHQPSRVADALALQRRIADSTVQVYEANVTPPEPLVREVGVTLASFLAEAETIHDDSRQRLVVVVEPVWKIGTAMEAEADLSAYRKHICSARDVVDELVRRGKLAERERDRLRSRTEFRPMPVAPRPQIENGAFLLLDDPAVSLLQGSNLLGTLHRAGFKVIVPLSEVEEARQLIEHNARADEALALVEELRGWLQGGLEDGWVRLGDAVAVNEQDDGGRWFGHPSATLLHLAEQVDACVFDDRFINRHAMMSTQDEGRPLLTTWDILDDLKERGVVGAATRLEARAMLRQAGYALAPLDSEELEAALAAARVVDGVVEETVGLRAIRESITRLRMSNVLQLPHEAPWLDRSTGICLQVLQSLWFGETSEDRRWACSDWLLYLIDPRGWVHRMAPEAGVQDSAYRVWLRLLLMLPVGRPEAVAEAYGQWFEDRVLLRLQQEEPDVFKVVVEDAIRRIEAIAMRSEEMVPSNG